MKQIVLGILIGVCGCLAVWAYFGGEVHAQSRGGDRSSGAAQTGGVASGPAGCVGDLNRDGVVDGLDLLALLANWGPCPCDDTLCNGDCVDLDSDDDHCGACNTSCAGGTVCEAGQCVQLQTWYQDLDGDGWGDCDVYVVAANPPRGWVSMCGDCDDTDPTVYPGAPEFCNGIDNDCDGIVDNNVVDCPTGTVCDNGSCVPTCGVGETDCGGTCVNLSTNTSHCGGCGIACFAPNATTTCSSGVCGISSCNPGWGNCDGSFFTGCETNLNTTSNCGACGVTCQLANAVSSCSSGTCSLAFCNPGFGDCDGNPSNGCEVNLNTSISNCGACGNFCPSRPNATTTCVSGSCGFFCNPGFGDCDGNPSNGCEVNLNTSISNCGACGNTCPPGTSCVSGACQ